MSKLLISHISTDRRRLPEQSGLCVVSQTTPLACNQPGSGVRSFSISQTPNVDAIQCHENCLADPDCESFQIQTVEPFYCNLYYLPTLGNMLPTEQSDAYRFYDRNCPDLQPVSGIFTLSAPLGLTNLDFERRPTVVARPNSSAMMLTDQSLITFLTTPRDRLSPPPAIVSFTSPPLRPQLPEEYWLRGLVDRRYAGHFTRLALFHAKTHPSDHPSHHSIYSNKNRVPPN